MNHHSRRKYLLCPGNVRSKTDGDVHFVPAFDLAALYGVKMHECHVRPSDDCYGSLLRNRDLDESVRRGELVELYPDPTGVYASPRKP